MWRKSCYTYEYRMHVDVPTLDFVSAPRAPSHPSPLASGPAACAPFFSLYPCPHLRGQVCLPEIAHCHLPSGQASYRAVPSSPFPEASRPLLMLACLCSPSSYSTHFRVLGERLSIGSCGSFPRNALLASSAHRRQSALCTRSALCTLQRVCTGGRCYLYTISTVSLAERKKEPCMSNLSGPFRSRLQVSVSCACSLPAFLWSCPETLMNTLMCLDRKGLSSRKGEWTECFSRSSWHIHRL